MHANLPTARTRFPAALAAAMLLSLPLAAGCLDPDDEPAVVEPGDGEADAETTPADLDADFAAEVEAEPVTETEADPEPEADTDPESEAEPEPDPEPEADPEPELEAEAEPEAEAESELEPEGPAAMEYSLFPEPDVLIEPCARETEAWQIPTANNAVWSDGRGTVWFGAMNGVWMYDEAENRLRCDENVGEIVVCLDGRLDGETAELWAGFARGKVGRLRDGVWTFDTIPEIIQDTVPDIEGAEGLEESQGMVWALALRTDGTLAVQGPRGVALRDPSGVWTVPDCPDVEWGMPEIVYPSGIISQIRHIDRLPYAGLQWRGETLYAGAERAIVAVNGATGVCETACATDEGQLAVLPSRTERMLVGRSLSNEAMPDSFGNYYFSTKTVGECVSGTWRSCGLMHDGQEANASTGTDLNRGVIIAHTYSYYYFILQPIEYCACHTYCDYYYAPLGAFPVFDGVDYGDRRCGLIDYPAMAVCSGETITAVMSLSDEPPSVPAAPDVY